MKRTLALVILLACAVSSWAAAPGNMHNSTIGGIDTYVATRLSDNDGADPVAMHTLNAGLAFRFQAKDTRDVKSVNLYWANVATPGQVTVRIETVDATTGKPSGSLYDASAAKTAIAPTLGLNTITFASLPTAGLTAGNWYAVVVLTTTGGTTSSIASSAPATSFGVAVLTAADGTTRSNFAEVTGGSPICSLIYEDDAEEPTGMSPWYTRTLNAVNSTIAYGAKFTAVSTMKIAGVKFIGVRKAGSPGDMRVRIFNGNSAVSGASVTVDKDMLSNVSYSHVRAWFPAPVSLTAGSSYRVVMDQPGAAVAGNDWSILSFPFISAAPGGFLLTSTADVTAGTITWTDSTTATAGVQLILDTITTTSGGTASYIYAQ